MTLPAGTRLGPYEILAPIGAGGMGEVYRARDTRLGRDVAVKILPALFAADSERRARFEREGRAIAALSHPNILAIFDIGREGSTDYVVTELLEGQTVRDRLANGPLPVRESLAYAVQIVRGLAVAHDKGVTHRDLKPENLFVTHDGTVKILDFGLAKLLDPGASDVTGGDGTAAGSVMGTIGYMAPEQLRGSQVDHRADIFAFGAVFYEMLSGRRAFAGDSTADSISATLSAEPPDFDAHVSGVHPPLARIVRRCLEKRPEARFQSAHDLVFALEAGGGVSNVPAAGAEAPRATDGRRRMSFILIGGLIVLASAGSWLASSRAPSSPAAPGVSGTFAHALPDGQIFTRTGRRSVAISPDGTKIAFIANLRIYLRHLHELDARPIPGTDVDPVELTFSPNGRSLAFFVPVTRLGTVEGAVLKTVDIDGGPLATVSAGGAPFGLSWQGTRLLFSTGTHIQVVDETGGTPETLVEALPGSGETLAQPLFLNGGADLLYQAGNDVVLQTLGSSERRVVLQNAMEPRVLPTGHLIFVRDSAIFGQRFDAASGRVSGAAVALVQGVQLAGNSRGSHSSVSDDGTLVYVPDRGPLVADLMWVDRRGRETPTGAPTVGYTSLRLSDDGARVVLNMQGDLRVWDFATRIMSTLTSGPAADDYPVWTPDGRSIVYRSNLAGQQDIFRRAADGTGGAEQLTNDAALDAAVDVVDNVGSGARMLGAVIPGHSRLGILDIPSAAPGRVASLVFTMTAPVLNAAVSPDGRWIAYQAVEGSAAEEVHVRPFPNLEGGHWQISSGGGSKPLWTRGGRELVFLGPGVDHLSRRYYSVTVAAHAPATTSFSHASPTLLFEIGGHWLANHPGGTYAVTPDGSRFLIIRERREPNEIPHSLTVVTHWFDVIRARLPAR